MSAPPRVVLMSGNDVVSDARVLKYLATLSGLGLDVTAVGVTRGASTRHTQIGDVEVLVPSVPLPRPSSLRARRDQLGVVFAPGYRTRTQERAARAQLKRWGAAAGRRRGPLRWAVRGALLVARSWYGLARTRLRLSDSTGDDQRAGQDLRRAEIEKYRRGPAAADWRTVLPQLVNDDEVIGPIVDALRPDLIHVHDVFMLGVAAGAVVRARAAGRRVHLVYDAHEFVSGVAYVPTRTIGALSALEDEFIGAADRIVTVSEPLAELLRIEHGLAATPAVVLNAPVTAPPSSDFQDLRDVVGLDDSVPLLVYGGGVNSARGVHTAVAALPYLPGTHLAVVTNRHNYVVEGLVELGAELGVSDRLHLAPYVRPEHVPRYFARADIGLSTLLRSPNHDVAVTNKFCEYIQAGIPIVTSDTPAQAQLVDELGLGSVYPAGDVLRLVEAVQRVMTHRTALRSRIASDQALRERFSWPAQAAVIRTLYADLLGALPPDAWAPDALQVTGLGVDPDR